MNARVASMVAMLCSIATLAFGQSTSSPPRAITLHEAVELALAHNHVVRRAALKVQEQEHAKETARSAYFPVLRNDSNLVRVSETQLVEIPAGALGAVGGRVPSQPLVLNQGGQTFISSGTGLIQPLTQLLKTKAANDVAHAEVDAARGRARGIENDIALKVHQLYYKILVAELRRSAVLAKIEAADDLHKERAQQVKFGSALDADLIESRAQSLQAKQELLTTELQLSDLHMQFNDVVGFPLGAAVMLDPVVAAAPDSCAREECVKLAVDSHPEIAEARATVEKAESAVRLARYEFVPDVEAYARYSFQNNVPFLAGNFGTVGIHLSYDLFDGGRKRAVLRSLAGSSVAQELEAKALLLQSRLDWPLPKWLKPSAERLSER